MFINRFSILTLIILNIPHAKATETSTVSETSFDGFLVNVSAALVNLRAPELEAYA